MDRESNPLFPKMGSKRKAVPPKGASSAPTANLPMKQPPLPPPFSPLSAPPQFPPLPPPQFPPVSAPPPATLQKPDKPKPATPIQKIKPVKKSGNSCGQVLCATNLLVPKHERKRYIQITLVEAVIYLVYLVITCCITYGMTSSSSYYYTSIVSRLFVDTPFQGTEVTFRSSSSIEDFWKFAETTMVDGLYWKYWYGVQDINNLVPERHQGILHENKLFARPRLRQIRVRVEKCKGSEKFKQLSRECYPSYSYNHEEKKAYNSLLADEDAWKYHSEKKLNGSSYWGRLAIYSGAGAIQLLGTEKEETLQIIMQLKNNLWINRATRVIFLDFTLHNANVNLFCVVKLVWEFLPTGGVITSWNIRTIRLLRYTNSYDYVILVLDIIFAVFTLYYTIQEVVEMFNMTCGEYWSSPWSYVDIAIILISYTLIAYSIFREYFLWYIVADTLRHPALANAYFPFDYFAFFETQFTNAIAVLVFFAWIKLFKFISINKTMTQLSTTMSRCAKDVGGFAIMFFIVFFAFAQLGYLLFGSQVEDFRTFHDTVFSLLRLILGDFNFRAIESANRVLGPIFFITYVFFVFFVLLNMFLAIINDTYSQVKAEDRVRGEEYQVTDYVKHGFSSIFCCGGKGKSDVEGQMRLEHSENIIKTDEIRQNLKRSNFADVEIEMFLTRYELDEERPLDVDEAEYVLGGLEGNHSVSGERDENIPKTAGENKTLTDEEISELQSRVGVLESSLTGVTRKLDALMHKLNSIPPAPVAQSRPLL